MNVDASLARKTIRPSSSSRRAGPLQRGVALDPLDLVGVLEVAGGRRREECRPDRIDPDRMVPPLRGEAARERDDPCFRGAVGRERVAVDRPLSTERGDVDDRAADAPFEHRATHELRQLEHRREIGVDHVAEVVDGRIEGWRARRDAGVVHEDVDVSERPNRLVVEAPAVSLDGHVARDDQ